MTKEDKELLQWIHDRLIYVYHEKPNMGFLHHLRKIIYPRKDTNYKMCKGGAK